MGIRGNEWADTLAKQALSFTEVSINVEMSVSEVVSCVRPYFVKLWQREWDISVKGCFYYNFNPSVHVTQPVSGFRRCETLFFRLQSGHIPVNSYICRFKLHKTGLCDVCHVDDTVSHFIFDCQRFNNARCILYSELRKVNILNASLENILNPETNRNKVFQIVANFLLRCHRFN